MKLISWNINSIRLRLESLLRLLQQEQPDILCLQETKCPDEFFPRAALAAAGYPHQAILGMKSYNGVAILSRHPMTEITPYHWVNKQDCRHISARIQGLDIHSVYVPAGGDIPDRNLNDKFGHKLDFVAAQTACWQARDSLIPTVLMGDLNIAPLEHDVWSHKQLLNVVSHTPIEVDAMTAWIVAGKFTDTARHFVPASEKLFSWWSYRNHDWRASNRGRRLDHIWVTPPLIPALASHQVLIDIRDWEQPSDHAPVCLELL